MKKNSNTIEKNEKSRNMEIGTYKFGFAIKIDGDLFPITKEEYQSPSETMSNWTNIQNRRSLNNPRRPFVYDVVKCCCCGNEQVVKAADSCVTECNICGLEYINTKIS